MATWTVDAASWKGATVGSGASGANVGNTSGSHDNGSPMVNGHPTNVHEANQAKHMPGETGFIEGRSEFTGTMEDAQRLISEFAGTGQRINDQKERVDFGEVIGNWVDQDTVEKFPTTRGIIHYGKNGAHVVPSRPDGE